MESSSKAPQGMLLDLGVLPSVKVTDASEFQENVENRIVGSLEASNETNIIMKEKILNTDRPSTILKPTPSSSTPEETTKLESTASSISSNSPSSSPALAMERSKSLPEVANLKPECLSPSLVSIKFYDKPLPPPTTSSTSASKTPSSSNPTSSPPKESVAPSTSSKAPTPKPTTFHGAKFGKRGGKSFSASSGISSAGESSPPSSDYVKIGSGKIPRPFVQVIRPSQPPHQHHHMGYQPIRPKPPAATPFIFPSGHIHIQPRPSVALPSPSLSLQSNASKAVNSGYINMKNFVQFNRPFPVRNIQAYKPAAETRPVLSKEMPLVRKVGGNEATNLETHPSPSVDILRLISEAAEIRSLEQQHLQQSSPALSMTTGSTRKRSASQSTASVAPTKHRNILPKP